MDINEAERLIRLKMLSRGMSNHAIDLFLSQVCEVAKKELSENYDLNQLKAPDSGLLLEPPLEEEQKLELDRRGMDLLGSSVIIKLNGGRSTTMGGNVPKGILTAKNGLSYLEIICNQTEAVRKKCGIDIPLVLMNSFFTDAPTHKVLAGKGFSALTFLQKEVPRLIENNLCPLETNSDDDWVPPGHGDVYDSLSESGLLDRLLAQGIKWAFLSNLDNLAASLEPWILGLMDLKSIDFLLEVTDRTDEDRKGGTLVVNKDRLELLEIGQVPREQLELFMDIDKFMVFNTNNVWINLNVLKDLLENKSIHLPIIRNRKKILGHNVIQIETAMGTAMGSFENARGLRVGRDRFFPTKKIEDLFVLQSDACVLDEYSRIKRNPMRPADLPLRPLVTFSSDFLDSPHNIPDRFADLSSVSLVSAESLEVHGPVYFEPDIRIQGKVVVTASTESQCVVPRGTIFNNTEIVYK
jgi:UTP--glucose-1-phosphate uridylyltransferase